MEQIPFDKAMSDLKEAAAQEATTRRDKQTRALRVKLASLALDAAAVVVKAEADETARGLKAGISERVAKAKREANAATK